MKRIFLFVLTNLAVLFVINISLRLLGVDRVVQANGINFNALLVMSLVIGFSGSIVSLFMSKWSAKMAVGAQVIENPIDPTERWLVETIRRQASAAGIGMPEVAIYDAPDLNAFATGWNRNAALVAVSTGLLHNMSRDEVETAWRWIDPILEAWSESSEQPKPYTSGTWGPAAAVALIERDGRTWYEDGDV